MTDGSGRIVFLPDAHLSDPQGEDFRDLVAFLDELTASLGPADAVVIMGDLFDFWMGFRYVIPYKFLSVLSSLLTLSRRGVAIHYTEGNHDFFMGPFFTESLGATVHPSQWELTHGGLRILVAHGDQVNKKDWGYRFLRRLLRSLPVKVLGRLVPPFMLEKIARAMSRASRVYTDNKKDDREGICREFAVLRFFEGYDGVVLGHVHQPDLWKMELDGRRRTYVNVGRWMDRRDYVVLEGDEFRPMRRSIPADGPA